MILPFSRMNLPSLYFCDSSTALTCFRSDRGGEYMYAGALLMLAFSRRWKERTYFQPITVLHDVQWMSATECSPVMSNLSSLGPSVMLTLQEAAWLYIAPFSRAIPSICKHGTKALVLVASVLCTAAHPITNVASGHGRVHIVDEICPPVTPLELLQARKTTA